MSLDRLRICHIGDYGDIGPCRSEINPASPTLALGHVSKHRLPNAPFERWPASRSRGRRPESAVERSSAEDRRRHHGRWTQERTEERSVIKTVRSIEAPNRRSEAWEGAASEDRAGMGGSARKRWSARPSTLRRLATVKADALQFHRLIAADASLKASSSGECLRITPDAMKWFRTFLHIDRQIRKTKLGMRMFDSQNMENRHGECSKTEG